ncbi:hypothetical protein WDU94_010771 [Cyamophila willieti]
MTVSSEDIDDSARPSCSSRMSGVNKSDLSQHDKLLTRQNDTLNSVLVNALSVQTNLNTLEAEVNSITSAITVRNKIEQEADICKDLDFQQREKLVNIPTMVSLKERQIMQEIVNGYIKDGIVTQSTGEWSSPTLLVRKKTDDFVIHAPTFEEHWEKFEKVMLRLQEVNLKINFKKCQFGYSEIELLGHRVCSEGVKTSPAKISSIIDFKPPKTVKQVRQFLGLTGYYRKFSKDYARVAGPMTDLTKKDEPFKWTDSQQKSFDTLKDLLVTAPVLRHFDEKLPTSLACDASKEGLGVVLSQTEDGVTKPVAFASRRLSSCEQNYPNAHREMLAICCYTSSPCAANTLKEPGTKSDRFGHFSPLSSSPRLLSVKHDGRKQHTSDFPGGRISLRSHPSLPLPAQKPAAAASPASSSGYYVNPIRIDPLSPDNQRSRIESQPCVLAPISHRHVTSVPSTNCIFPTS